MLYSRNTSVAVDADGLKSLKAGLGSNLLIAGLPIGVIAKRSTNNSREPLPSAIIGRFPSKYFASNSWGLARLASDGSFPRALKKRCSPKGTSHCLLLNTLRREEPLLLCGRQQQGS